MDFGGDKRQVEISDLIQSSDVDEENSYMIQDTKFYQQTGSSQQIGPNHQSIEASDSSKGYRPAYYATRNDDDNTIRCDACFDHEWEDEDDQIIMCDACNCSVHYKCYKKADPSLAKGIPEGDWYCLRCA